MTETPLFMFDGAICDIIELGIERPNCDMCPLQNSCEYAFTNPQEIEEYTHRNYDSYNYRNRDNYW